MPDRPQHDALAATRLERYNPDTVETVSALVASEPVVVVGMGWNPHVKRARKALEAADVSFAYHQIGNYAGQWPQRLAVKMWSGWPTFPQVFVKGVLIGGADQTEEALSSGRLRELLDAKG